MLMLLPIAPMGVKHRDVPPAQRLAPDGAIEIIQALCPAAHERAQHDRRVLVKSGAEHRWHRQDDVPIDDALVEDFAHLTDPVVDIHFGAAQAQGRFATHRHTMFTLATVRAAVFEVPHLVWVATPEHLRHKIIIVGRLVTRMGLRKLFPVIGKDLLEDVPVPRGCCKHQGAPSWGVEMVVQRLYHTSPAPSTPSAVCMGTSSSPSLPLIL